MPSFRELIEKIKAASQGRKTIAIIEPVNKDRNCSRRPWQPPASGGGRWRHVGVVSPLQSHNISDHDYCSPGRKPSKMVKTEVENLQQSLNQTTSMEVTSPRETRGRDSGLESAEMSDASEVGIMRSEIYNGLTDSHLNAFRMVSMTSCRPISLQSVYRQ